MSWWLLLSRPSGEKGEEKAQKQFLSRPSAQQGEICLSRMIQAIWTPDPCCLMNPTYIKHPQHHPHHHPWGAIHPDHCHAHPSIIPIQRIICGAQLRGLLTQRQEETPVWTSFHQTLWHWQRTHTWTFSSFSRNFTSGTLQNTVAGQG